MLVGRSGQLQVEAARLVWRADVSKGESDLALLRVPRRLGQVFEWAADFQVGKRAPQLHDGRAGTVAPEH